MLRQAKFFYGDLGAQFVYFVNYLLIYNYMQTQFEKENTKEA